MPSDSSTTGSTSLKTAQETSTSVGAAGASTSTSLIPEHTLAPLRKQLKRVKAEMASRMSSAPRPEGPAEKLLKYGGDPEKLTPAQIRRIRKAERKSRG